MTVERIPSRKPLLFSTTLRNPDRIAGFLDCLLPFEIMILTETIINNIVNSLISKKLYFTIYQKQNENYKAILQSEDLIYTSS